MHSDLDAVGSDINNSMDQFYLIVIYIKVQNQIKKEERINSFKILTCSHTTGFCLISRWVNYKNAYFLQLKGYLRQELQCMMLFHNVGSNLLSRNGMRYFARLTKFTGMCH